MAEKKAPRGNGSSLELSCRHLPEIPSHNFLQKVGGYVDKRIGRDKKQQLIKNTLMGIGSQGEIPHNLKVQK